MINNLKNDLANLLEEKNVLMVKAQRNEEEENKLKES